MSTEAENLSSPGSFAARLVLTVFTALGAVPLGARQRLGRMCGRIFSMLPTREKRIAELQLQAFLPGVDPAPILPGIFESLGQTVLEGMNLEPIIRNHHETIYCRQPELFEWAAKANRPILGLTAHTGNWELFAAYLIARGVKMVAIGRPARNAVMHEALAAIRERAGIKVIWRADQSGMKEIYKSFQSNLVIGALIDQDTRVTSVPVPFFGSPAQTPSTLVYFAKRYSALVFSAFIVREKDGRYALDIKKLNENGSIEEILREYHEALEAVIRENPSQWVWFHKRWRTLPSGERLSSAEYKSFLQQRAQHV